MGNVNSCTSSGLKDWFLQRVTAIIIMLYAVFIFIVILSSSGNFSYDKWLSIFQCIWVKIFTIFTFFSLIIHSWIGMWTVFTDYVKCAYVRGMLQSISVAGYIACFIWLICILF